jgi:cytochrome oxidase Cu insertion factor (SCO1/SenC/PrrC family)
MTWPSGARAAPAFTLRDQNGRSVSITDLLGRDALITFIDPLCRNFCPLEARVLGEAAASLPLGERPSIVAVSVNRWGDARANLVADEQKWRVGSDWKWAIGSPRALASVWRRYGIGVQDVPRTLAGVTVHEITHTEAAYLIDRSGHERALFVWPFTARTVENTVTSLAGS